MTESDKIESEIKLELRDRDTFLKVRRFFLQAARSEGSPERQVNHYLDSAGLELARKLVMLRLRAGRSRVLTLKSGTRIRAGHFQAREVEAVLGEEDYRRALSDPGCLHAMDLPPIRLLHEEHGSPELRIIGALENQRTRCAVDGYTVEIDLMTFPDGTEEYELEIESEDSDKTFVWCRKHFQSLGLEPIASTETKFQRLLRKIASPA